MKKNILFIFFAAIFSKFFYASDQIMTEEKMKKELLQVIAAPALDLARIEHLCQEIVSLGSFTNKDSEELLNQPIFLANPSYGKKPHFLEMIKTLKRQGLDFKVQDQYGISILHKIAHFSGESEAFSFLIDENEYNDINSGQITILHYAAENHQLAMMQKLIERGADVMKKTKEGKTALDLIKKLYPLDYNYQEMIQALDKAEQEQKENTQKLNEHQELVSDSVKKLEQEGQVALDNVNTGTNVSSALHLEKIETKEKIHQKCSCLIQ